MQCINQLHASKLEIWVILTFTIAAVNADAKKVLEKVDMT